MRRAWCGWRRASRASKLPGACRTGPTHDGGERTGYAMKAKSALLIINPRRGKNVARLSDVLAVLSAAGWKTDTALKEFRGHTMELAKAATETRYDLVIGYGGDGTLNQVVNG